ncbi:MAG: PAS domain-containing sensor histidine kinase [Nitrospirae bacterium]|nr:PAS domain-containing sensor histidine kinase [Nitrospirota bacterium]
MNGKSEKELIKHQQQLEELVEERTAELRSAYELLKEEITDRRQAEAEALRSGHLAALGELAAGVAHEINNPINGIINYAQILINRGIEGSKEHDIAKRIIKESDRIAVIVNSLLSFARDRKEINSIVRISEIIYDTLALTETHLKKDGIIIRVQNPSDMYTVSAQRQQLLQVFLNIVSNSRYALNEKYSGMHEDKILEIQCEKIMSNENPYIRLSFHDRGTGIPADALNKVMNPFFSTKPSGIGTGLGLSISHSIISNHGGKLIIDSVEGEFTNVIIQLPLTYFT